LKTWTSHKLNESKDEPNIVFIEEILTDITIWN